VVVAWDAEHLRDHADGEWLGELGRKIGALTRGDRIDELTDDLSDPRLQLRDLVDPRTDRGPRVEAPCIAADPCPGTCPRAA
jgi:hypothetical protein